MGNRVAGRLGLVITRTCPRGFEPAVERLLVLAMTAVKPSLTIKKVVHENNARRPVDGQACRMQRHPHIQDRCEVVVPNEMQDAPASHWRFDSATYYLLLNTTSVTLGPEVLKLLKIDNNSIDAHMRWKVCLNQQSWFADDRVTFVRFGPGPGCIEVGELAVPVETA